MITGKAGLRRPSGGKATICLRPVRATSKYEGSGNLTRLVPGFSCSLSCSSPRSRTVHGGTCTALTCAGVRPWTYGYAEQRLLIRRLPGLRPRPARQAPTGIPAQATPAPGHLSRLLVRGGDSGRRATQCQDPRSAAAARVASAGIPVQPRLARRGGPPPHFHRRDLPLTQAPGVPPRGRPTGSRTVSRGRGR